MLRARVLSAVLFVPVVLALVVLGEPWLTLLVGALAVLAARETFMLLARSGQRGEPLLGATLALALVLAAASEMQPAAIAAAAGMALVLAAIAAFPEPNPRLGVQAWLATLFAAGYAGSLAFLVRLAADAPAMAPGAPLAAYVDAGRGWILAVIFIVWGYDTAAYVTGRSIGRHRFLVHLSPGKTWEGVVGGVIAATAVAAVFLAAIGHSPVGAFALGPLLAAAAQAGDLAESMLKRAAGVKDASGLIPGHGGVLDRVDSFLFAGPAAYLYLLVTTRGP